MELPPPDSRSLCPLSSTEFVETPNPRRKFLGTPLVIEYYRKLCEFRENRTEGRTFLLGVNEITFTRVP